MTDTAGSSAPLNLGGETKTALQLRRLQEANAKYKKLLQLAKDRIQQQEEELQAIREENNQHEVNATKAAESINIDEEPVAGAGEQLNVGQVCQLVKQVDAKRGLTEIWALLETEAVSTDDQGDYGSSRRYKEWKRFDTETQLQDFIRRDTGEPLHLPPYSLSPDQSSTILAEAQSQVSQITEDFRRFRVRAELARKQAEAQIRDLQNSKVTDATHRIENHSHHGNGEQTGSIDSQLERMRAELAAQDVHWKEAYDVLLQENQALQSSGSEALLASQWRHRYETCLKEKEQLESRAQVNGDDSKWEAKYRDLKESFRMYRKKAKEIFETQERGGTISLPGMPSFALNDQSSAEAKLSYLKNLMVNYFSSSPDMKEHMETAIATVLRFTPDDLHKIEKQKAGNESWFSIY